MGRNPSETGYNQAMGQRLRQVRINGGYKAEEMSEAIQCTLEHYRKVENGKRRLTLEQLKNLHRNLHVDPTYIITGNECAPIAIEEHLINCEKETSQKRLQAVWDLMVRRMKMDD